MPVRTKEERIQIRLETAELERWRAAADADGLTLSNWIRKCCNEYASRSEDLRELQARAAKAAKKGRRS